MRRNSTSRRPAPGSSSVRTAPARCSEVSRAAWLRHASGRSEQCRGPSPALGIEPRLRRSRQRTRARRRTVHPGDRQHRDLGGRARMDLCYRSARASRRGHRYGVRRRDLRRHPRPCLRRARGPRRHRTRLHDGWRGDVRLRGARIARTPGAARGRVAGWTSAGVPGPTIRRRALADMLPAMLFGLLIVPTRSHSTTQAGAPSRSLRCFSGRASSRSCSTRCSDASATESDACCRFGRRSERLSWSMSLSL